MSPPGIHNRIIATTARAILSPAGFRQRGRSRLWYLDHGWWLTLVDFQASAWSRGTYLNLSAMWLWSPAPDFHFDFWQGSDLRLAKFCEYVDESQFERAVEGMAVTAVKAAKNLHRELARIEDVADHLAAQPNLGGWPLYDAGVAALLAGRTSAARRYFATMALPDDDDREWWIAERDYASRLADVIGKGDDAKAMILEDVRRARTGLKLPIWDEVFR